MTDRDRDLQDNFDRHLRGEGPPPPTDDDPEAAAYEAVYAALGEAPNDTLPDDFAEQVAARADLSPDPGMGWAEVGLLCVLIAGAGAGLVWMPPGLAGLRHGLDELAFALQGLSGAVRVDTILASALVLFATMGLDTLVHCLRPGPSPHST